MNELIAEFNQNYDFSDKMPELSGTASIGGLNLNQNQIKDAKEDLKQGLHKEVTEYSNEEEGEVYGPLSSGRNVSNEELLNQFKK